MKKYLFFFLMIVSFHMAHADPFAYVANYGADNVSIVDLATSVVIGYVDNGGFNVIHPVDVRHSPDSSKAYLLSEINNAMFVIDTSSNKIIKRVDSRKFKFKVPNTVRFSLDGTKAYVTNKGGNNISIIDVATDTITGYVADFNQSCDLPIDIAFAKDGTHAYVVNYNGNSIGLINVSSDTIIGMVDTSAFPLDQPTFCFIATSLKAYVTCLHSGKVAIIDVANHVVTGYIAPGSNAFNLPFSVLGTTNKTQEMAMDPGVSQALFWTRMTDSVTHVVYALNSPRNFVISNDNRLAYVTDVGINGVHIVDLSNYIVSGFFDSSAFPFKAPFAISIP